MIYLDSSATSFLKPPTVEQAVVNAMHTIGNAGRGAHAPTLAASRLLYQTREKLAWLFGVSDPARIAFTCNATEALNIAIGGLIGKKDHVITTVCEHNSVLRPLYRTCDRGIDTGETGLTIHEADDRGRIQYETLEESLRPNTKAVVVTHASNVTGNVTDLKRIASFTKKHGLLLIVDASQSAGAIPISVEEMGIDVLCFTGHKGLFGPQGTGGIYVRKGLQVWPLKVGGSGVHSFDREHPKTMPEALEAGTVNGHGIAGLLAGLDFLEETGIEAIHAREDKLARRFASEAARIPGVILYGDYEADLRAPIVSLNIGKMDSGLVSDYLWEDAEICVRAGAHCAPLMHEHFGTVEQGMVRFSFSYFNTEEEVDRTVEALTKIAEDYLEDADA